MGTFCTRGFDFVPLLFILRAVFTMLSLVLSISASTAICVSAFSSLAVLRITFSAFCTSLIAALLTAATTAVKNGVSSNHQAESVSTPLSDFAAQRLRAVEPISYSLQPSRFSVSVYLCVTLLAQLQEPLASGPMLVCLYHTLAIVL
jgi:hypothetical protein